METESTLPVKKFHPDAVVPKRHYKSAGYDLYLVEDVVLQPLGREVVSTGIGLEIPEGYYGRIADRSGLATNHGIHVLGGVVDEDYRGEIKIILFNTSANVVSLAAGSRGAQIIITPYMSPWPVEIADLAETIRGGDGFGSTS